MATKVKLGNSNDHLITMDINLEDGGPVIEVTLPLLNWMPPPRVDEYDAWFADARTKVAKIVEWEDARATWEKEHDEWDAAGRLTPDGKPGGTFRRGPSKKPPYDAEKELLPVAGHQFALRWLHPFVSEEDFRRIWLTCRPGLAADIFAALHGGAPEADDVDEDADGAEITMGESSASSDS